MEKGRIIWLTGLSGAGKSTIAGLLYNSFLAAKRNVEVLDGDEVRTNLSKGLGFSKEDRDTNVKRIGYVAHKLAMYGPDVIVAAISPYRETREFLKQYSENFIEVYVKTDIETCKKRDPKGLYKKVEAGEIKNFTGIDDPYEEPENPDIILDTDQMDLLQCFNHLVLRLAEFTALLDADKDMRKHHSISLLVKEALKNESD